MILIDTSAWIEFFRKRGDLHIKQKIATYLELDQAAYTCPIYFEILAGAEDHEKDLILETFELSERMIFKPEFWEIAATMERKLRRKGITLPQDDIFVATVANEMDLPLLCKDRHFNVIRDKCLLSLDLEQLA